MFPFRVQPAHGQALANGVIRDGVGAISIGRGGTNIAFSDNTVVLLDNPAGIVGMDGCGQFHLGIDGLITDLYYSDPFTADSAAIRPMGLPEFGLVRKIGDGNWAWGLTIAAPAGFGAHFNLDDPVFGRESYTSFGALVKILPGLACQVTDRLSVGGTLGVGFSSAKLDGPFYLQTGMLQGRRRWSMSAPTERASSGRSGRSTISRSERRSGSPTKAKAA